VGWSKNFVDALKQPVDKPNSRPPDGMPAGWSDIVSGLAKSEDIIILKRQWGAFHATELDLQLRRRGIKTIVLGGIATNMGVESTARQAWEHNYNLIVVEDITTSLTAEMHAFSMINILPRIAIVADSGDLEFAK
jgi:nicotinamidase-related amidase